MEHGDLKLQVFEGAVRADLRESFGELLGRGVGREGFYWIGSRRAECFGYGLQIVRIASQESDGKVSVRWVCEYSTYACATSRSLRRNPVNAPPKDYGATMGTYCSDEYCQTLTEAGVSKLMLLDGEEFWTHGGRHDLLIKC